MKWLELKKTSRDGEIGEAERPSDDDEDEILP